MSWTYTSTPCRDLPDAGWASTPTSCRDQVLGGLLYVDGLGGVELDAHLGSGATVSASGWTMTTLESCRDAE